VTNPAAVKHLREMKAGERLVIYHTATRRARGTATVVSVDASDPRCEGEDQSGEGDRKAEDAGGDQSAGGVCGVSAGAAGSLSVVPLTGAQFGWLAGSEVAACEAAMC